VRRWAIALAIVLASATPAHAADEASQLYAQGLAHDRHGAGHASAAVDCFLSAALLDHPGAQRALAAHYLAGRGVARSLPDAVRWYGRAASHGDGEAFWKLGALHERLGARAKAYTCYRLSSAFSPPARRHAAQLAAKRVGATLTTAARRDADELATAWRLTIAP
jgi:TPR repeat protein